MFAWLKEHSLVWLLIIDSLFVYDWIVLNKSRLNLNRPKALITTIIQVILGAFYAKLFAWIESGFVLRDAANIRMFGVIFFYPISYFLQAKITRVKYKNVFDIFLMATVFSLIISRINCLIHGCCVSVPLGESGFRLPIREAEIIVNAVFLIIFVPKVYKGNITGRLYPTYMIVYGLFRFIVEFFREEYDPAFGLNWLHLAHIWSILSVLIGVTALLIIRFKQPASRRQLPVQ